MAFIKEDFPEPTFFDNYFIIIILNINLSDDANELLWLDVKVYFTDNDFLFIQN